MIEFLRQVAGHFIARETPSEYCFIFPNRRSIAFFKKWWGKEALSAGKVPMVAPSMLTIDDFFVRASGMEKADRVSLLVKLYKCYSELYPKAESLDDFIYWGDVLLGDFGDVDKYLIDPEQIFTNVADFKSITDDYSYLTDVQRAAILDFIKHVQGKADDSVDSVKTTFRQIWNILLPLYKSFREALASEGEAYEGMIYRSLADSVKDESIADTLAASFPHSKKFVFVGLNALNECEKKVMRAMRNAGIAEFCWDYSGDMIKDPQNKSSLFMRKNVEEFRQAFNPDGGVVSLPKFHVVSVPSSVGQTRQVVDIIKDAVPDDCALVLPDESLLMPLLNTIPSDIEKINVTMGYPMASSEFAAFMKDIISLQLKVRFKDGSPSFYHKPVWSIFASGIFRKLTEGDEETATVVSKIKREKKYYVLESDLAKTEVLRTIFRAAVPEGSDGVAELEDYLSNVVSCVGAKMAVCPDYALEADFAKDYYTCINRLKAVDDLDIKASTFGHLMDSMVAGITVPFNGEPLQGLQIMGPLETRALDFKNVVILSANEGVFPHRSVSSSFIPPELRKGFGLPTYEYQDAVWAYYFYRLITRAENVWMIYDSRTEGLQSGEESRYIKQLRFHFGVELDTRVASSVIGNATADKHEIEKTQADIDLIRSKELSPSSLRNYIECPAKFYYKTVKGLNPEDEVAESLDSRTLGNVYHKTIQEILSGKKTVDKGFFEEWQHKEKEIRAIVIKNIKAEINQDEVSGRDLILASIIVRYVVETLKRDQEVLTKEGVDYYTIIGLERNIKGKICGLNFKGVIDRLDSISPGTLRLIDYKTGKDDPSGVVSSEKDAQKIADAIFDPANSSHAKYKAMLQFYIYDKMVEQSMGVSMDKISNSMYSTTDMFKNVPTAAPVNGTLAKLIEERLSEAIAELLNPEIAFGLSDVEKQCERCDFKMICGR